MRKTTKCALSALLTAAMTVTSFFAEVPSLGVFAADTETDSALVQAREFFGISEPVGTKVPDLTIQSAVAQLCFPTSAFCSTVSSYPLTQRWGYKELADYSNGAAMQNAYKAIYNSLVSFANEYSDIDSTDTYVCETALESYNITTSELQTVFFLLHNDCPEFYWLKATYKYSYNGSDIAVSIKFRATESYLIGEFRRQCDDKITIKLYEYEALTANYTSAYDVAYLVAQKMADDVKYAYDDLDNPNSADYAHCMMGIMDNSIAEGVCESYAEAYQFIMNSLGYEAIKVVGYANVTEAHAWNMLLIDGNYYWVDVTWLDREVSRGSKISTRFNFDYFLVGDDTFLTDHTVSMNTSVISDTVPETSATAYVPDSTLGKIGATADSGIFKYAITKDYGSVREAAVTKLLAGSNDMVVLNEIKINGNTYSVTAIDRYGVYQGTAPTYVTLPKSLTLILGYSFYTTVGTTIKGVPGSYAQTYATENGLAFISLHDYVSEVTTPATCTTPGVRTYTCTDCGDTYTEEIPPTGHNYTSEITTAATCTVPGVRTYTCQNCGDTYTEAIAAIGHDYTSAITTAATCTVPGVRTYTCQNCGDTYTEAIAALGHQAGDWIIDSEATATVDGSKHKECIRCGLTLETAVIPKTAVNFETSDDCHYDNIADQTHNNGTAITPTLSVYDSTKLLTLGTDYTVKYSNNINVGTATITVTGKGSYTGTFNVTFKIVARSLSNTTASLSATSYTYNGSAKKPTVTVKDGTKTLVLNTDYTVTYSNNTNAGTATVTVNGKGNYTGTSSVTFSIVARSLSNTTASLSATSYTYSGSAKKPTVTVKDGTKALVLNTDYTVTYSNNTNTGKATVTVTGKGNYAGTKTLTFTIKPKKTAGLKLSAYGTTYNTITWTKAAGNVTGYEIYARKGTGTYALIKTITSASTVTYKYEGLTAGTRYRYKIRAYKTINGVKTYGVYSAEISVYTKANKPTVSSTTINKTNITVKWSISGSAQGYQIRINKNGSSSVNSYTTTSKSYKLTELTKGTKYRIRIRAYVTINGTKIYSSNRTQYITTKS